MAQGNARRQPQRQQNRGDQGGRQLTVAQERKIKVERFSGFVDVLTPQMAEASAKGVDLAKLKRIAVMAVTKNPDLLDCTIPSWTTALSQCAQDGLMPDGREAAFVKFRNEVVYMPMVYGLRKKILQSGEVRDIFTAVVYAEEFAAGLFEVELGSNPRIVHKPMLGAADRGEIIAAYSVATYKDGTRSFEVMTRAEIERVRAVSRAEYKARTPWHDWYGEMARKTVLRRHSKALPMSSDIRDVEADAMFGPGFERALRQRDEDRTLTDGHRTTQLPTSATREQVDSIEARAEKFGAETEVPHDAETGEIKDDAGQHDSSGAGEQEQGDASPDEVESRVGTADDPGRATQPKQDEGEEQTADSGPTESEFSEEQIEANTKDADTLVDIIESKDLLLDLRSFKQERAAAIDGLDPKNRDRVWAAYDKREAKLQERPR